MQSDLESVIGNGARKLAQDLLGQKNLGVSVAYGCVSCAVRQRIELSDKLIDGITCCGKTHICLQKELTWLKR